MAGIEFFNKVAALAEEEGHHPDLHLEGYRQVAVEALDPRHRRTERERLHPGREDQPDPHPAQTVRNGPAITSPFFESPRRTPPRFVVSDDGEGCFGRWADREEAPGPKPEPTGREPGSPAQSAQRRAFSNAYRSMPFAGASGLWQATSPASLVFSTAIDPVLEYEMVEISEESPFFLRFRTVARSQFCGNSSPANCPGAPLVSRKEPPHHCSAGGASAPTGSSSGKPGAFAREQRRRFLSHG